MGKLDFAMKVMPKGYQIVSEKAIQWLFDNHREAYKGFYARVLDGVNGTSQQAVQGDGLPQCLFVGDCHLQQDHACNENCESFTPAP